MNQFNSQTASDESAADIVGTTTPGLAPAPKCPGKSEITVRPLEQNFC